MRQPQSRFSPLATFLYIIYGAAIMYFVFSKSPLLLKDDTLISQLQTEKSDGPVPWVIAHRNNMEASPAAAQSAEYDYRYSRELASPIATTPYGTGPKNLWWYFSSPNYLLVTKDQQQVQFFDLEHQMQWQFTTSASQQKLSAEPAIDGSFVYLATNDGFLICLHRSTGELAWVLPDTKLKFFGSLKLKDNALFATAYSEEKDAFVLVRAQKNSGQLEFVSEPIKHQLSTPLTASSQKPIILAAGTSTGQVIALDGDAGKILWVHNSEGTKTGPVSFKAGRAIFADDLGQSYGLNAKTGDVKWTYKLRSGSVEAFVLVPSSNDAAILTDSGYLHVIDTETGKGRWRYNTKKDGNHHEVLPLKLNPPARNKFKLDPNGKGWSLWAPCSENRICLLNPKTGQLLWRVRLRGELISNLYPQLEDATIFALIRDEESEPGGALTLGMFAQYRPTKTLPSKQVDRSKKSEDPFDIDEELDE